MKRNRFLCLVLTLVMALSLCVQGVTFTAFAESNAASLLLGDSNLDFKVNVKDATNIQKTIAKFNTLGEIATCAADVDKNENINIKDATAIQKWVANIDVPYLIGELFEYIGEILSDGGFILLNVNPEIRIGFNADGNVTTVDPANADAEALLKDFSDYQGKTCKEVVDRLLVIIKDAGYLIDEVDGENKLVVIQLEAGSKEPKDGFINELKDHAKKGLKDFDLKPEFIKIEGKDYDEKYATNDEASPYITLEKAIEIALAYSGVWAEDAVFEEKEYDIHRGTPYYELEFTANGFEFECVVNALNGKVVKFEKEKDNERHFPNATGDEAKPDNPQKPHKPATVDEFITLDEAKEIALKDAKLTKEEVKFTDRDFDLEDGTPYFELEFVTADYEYEYKIHAVSGVIIERECEPRDDDDNHRHDKDDDDDDDRHHHEKPDCTDPVESKPAEDKEEHTKPEFTEPDFTKPEFTKPVATEPSEEKPEFTKPVATEPSEEKPEFTKPVATEPSEKNPEPTKPHPDKEFIGIEDAKDSALNHAGANKDKVQFDKAELDEDNGKHKFEIEFVDGDFEYEYEIDAETGKILDFEKERKDR